jgi:hypothetical protein
MSKAALQKFEMEMLSELEGLAADVGKAGRSDLLPLDKSYASLDRVEDFYLLVVAGRVQVDKARAKQRVARYAGVTLAEHAGGKWASGTTETDPVVVTKLRAAPKATFQPMARVGELERWRYTGWLRDRTERHDLELQRATIDKMSGDLGGTLAKLRTAAKELSGSDPGALDSIAAVAKYQPVLARAAVASAKRELRRVIQRGTMVAIGQLVKSAVGRAEWTVEEDPKDIDFGTWRLFGVSMSNVVERVEPSDPAGSVQTVVEKMIAKRKK